MSMQHVKISSLLESLAPQDQEELSLIQVLLHCAQCIHRGLALPNTAEKRALWNVSAEARVLDIPTVLELIPEASKKYLHSLVEAIEIYQNIHGKALRVQGLTLSDNSFHELRQIRDLCLDPGIRAVY